MSSVSSVGVRRVEVALDDAGQRIDNFLMRELKGVPKSRIYQMLRRGEVRLNGARARPTARLAAGDVLRVPPVRVVAPGAEAVGSQRLADTLVEAVLVETDDLLVLNKPAGVAVHGGSGVSGAVIETLRAARAAPGLELVHRLDRDTSGCLAVAKRGAALRRAQAEVRERTVSKRYVAIVHGTWRRGASRIELPLQRQQRENEKVVRVASDGVPALTVVEAVYHGRGWTALAARLHTGRTHQIRVHLAHLGHPIVGDDKYGDAALDSARWSEGWPTRLYLHASELRVLDIVARAPLPEAFTRLGLPAGFGAAATAGPATSIGEGARVARDSDER